MSFPADHADADQAGGQVSTQRYGQLVARARELVESVGRAQFALGDLALEIEPMNPAGTGGTKAAGWVSSVRCGSSPTTSAWPPRR